MPLKRKAAEAVVSTSEGVAPDFTAFDDQEDGASDSSESNAEEEPEMSAETRAELLKGFDSESSEDDEGENAEDNRIIQLSNLTPDISKALEKKKSKTTESGVLYIGRIPHGFYEEEMNSYFAQFGTILNLRISRSKKTGRSKHFGFIEFADRGVAEIVATTMHNYLLASRLLQVILLTPEEFSKKGGSDLFKGAGKKFKEVPWATIAKQRVEAPKSQQQWTALQKREEKRRKDADQKIKAAGIDYVYEHSTGSQKRNKVEHKVQGKTDGAKVTGGKASAGVRKVSGKRVSVK